MKTLLISTFAAVALMACHKTETPAPTHPVVAITPSTTSHWQYMYDTCKKITLTADSITFVTCVNAVTQSVTHLGGDTVILQSGEKCLLHIVGDTLTVVPPPYNVWDSKYYRL